MTNERLSSVAIRLVFVPLLAAATVTGLFLLWEFRGEYADAKRTAGYHGISAKVTQVAHPGAAPHGLLLEYESGGRSYEKVIADNHPYHDTALAYLDRPYSGLVIYLDPDHPEVIAFQHYADREPGLTNLVYGGLLTAAGLLLLYLTLRRVRRVEQLFATVAVESDHKGARPQVQSADMA